MGRTFGFGLLVIAALLTSGCAMCCSPYDEAYGYTGGRWQRTDLCHGRVGSAFAPAGAEGEVIVEGEPAELPPPAPPSASRSPLKSIKKSSDWSGDLMNDQ
ncbi:MAG TPA: hypothetical protein VMP01_22340 [Pirellulaceae bacterium]|nr:hypothetical protein [Pirellulaceae bacterium]